MVALEIVAAALRGSVPFASALEKAVEGARALFRALTQPVDRRPDVDGRDSRDSPSPRLQESVWHPLVVRRVDEHLGAVEPRFDFRKRQESGELYVRRACCRGANALVERVFAAVRASDHDELALRQALCELEQDLRPLARAHHAHPENAVLGNGILLMSSGWLVAAWNQDRFAPIVEATGGALPLVLRDQGIHPREAAPIEPAIPGETDLSAL